MGGKRTATVQTENYCTIGHIGRSIFQDLIVKYPNFRAKLKEHITEYKDQWQLYVMKLLGNVDYFEYLPERILEDIFFALQHEYYQEGDTIFNFGESADEIYFITSGEVKLEIPRHDGDPVHIETLYSGAQIGSYGLLSDESRFFTCKANCETSVAKLTKVNLIGIQMKNMSFFNPLDRAEKWVKQNGIPMMDFRKFRNTRSLTITKKIFIEACRRLVRLSKAFPNMDAEEIFELLDTLKEDIQPKTNIPEDLEEFVSQTNNRLDKLEERQFETLRKLDQMMKMMSQLVVERTSTADK